MSQFTHVVGADKYITSTQVSDMDAMPVEYRDTIDLKGYYNAYKPVVDAAVDEMHKRQAITPKPNDINSRMAARADSMLEWWDVDGDYKKNKDTFTDLIASDVWMFGKYMNMMSSSTFGDTMEISYLLDEPVE